MSASLTVSRLLVFALFPVLMLAGCGNADATTPGSTESEEGLTIGSDAPPLTIEHWFDSKLGEEPVTEFEEGKVYMVEFWATWCPPCVASMPHLAELQEAHAEEGLTIISVSDEPLETIEPFLEGEIRNYQGDAEETPTYAELTSAYRLTTDPDESMSESYMRAAKQNGIPTSFLVGKTGQIEWIGHPMAVDAVLEAVLDDSWDRDAFAEEFRERQRIQNLQRELSIAMREGGPEKAYEVLDEFEASVKSAEAKSMVARLRSMVERQVFYSQLGEDPAADTERFANMVTAIEGDMAAINELTWGIYQNAAAGRPVSDELMTAAVDAGVAALELEGPRGSLLDTLAHLEYERGDLDSAIEFQTQASESPEVVSRPQMQAQIVEYLDALKAEKAAPAVEAEGEEEAATAEEEPVGT